MANGSDKHTVGVDCLIQEGIANLCQEIFKSSTNIHIYGMLLVQADEQNNFIVVQRKLTNTNTNTNTPTKLPFSPDSQSDPIDAAIDLSHHAIAAISPGDEGLGALVIANPDESDSVELASDEVLDSKLRKLSYSISGDSFDMDEHRSPQFTTSQLLTANAAASINSQASTGSLTDLGAILPIRELKEPFCEHPLSQESGILSGSLSGDTPSPFSASFQLARKGEEEEDGEAELKASPEDEEGESAPLANGSGWLAGAGSLACLEARSQVQLGSLPPVPEQCACPVAGCAQKFGARYELVSHLDDVHKETLCAWCTRNFSTRQNLKRHERLHTGHKPYVCSKCEERFHRRDALVTHVNRMHPGSEQPPSGLTHMAGAEQKQEDVAPADAGATGLEQSTKQSGAGGGAGGARSGYKCKLCQSELVDRDTFREHMLAAHDKPDLVFCAHCDFVFDARQGFQDHVNREHPYEWALSLSLGLNVRAPPAPAPVPAPVPAPAAASSRKREFDAPDEQCASLPLSPGSTGRASKQPSLSLTNPAAHIPAGVAVPHALADYYRQLASMLQPPPSVLTATHSVINQHLLQGLMATAATNAPSDARAARLSQPSGQHLSEQQQHHQQLQLQQQQQQQMALAFLNQMLSSQTRSLQASVLPTPAFLPTVFTSAYDFAPEGMGIGDPRLNTSSPLHDTHSEL